MTRSLRRRPNTFPNRSTAPGLRRSPGPPAAAQAVPGMGVHLVDGSDRPSCRASTLPTDHHRRRVWDGRYTFIEPMITREWLLSQPTLQENLKQTQAYQKSAYYPTTYAVNVDQQSKDYVIALTGLTPRQAA